MAVYLIQPGVLIGTNRYKIGRTSKKNFNRLKSYGRETNIISFNYVNNSILTELNLINKFNKKYKLIKGKEYFEGDIKNMLKDYLIIVLKEYTTYLTDNKIVKNTIKIQNWIRNIYLKKLYIIRNKNTIKIQNWIRNIYLKKLYIIRNKNTIKIQNWIRNINFKYIIKFQKWFKYKTINNKKDVLDKLYMYIMNSIVNNCNNNIFIYKFIISLFENYESDFKINDFKIEYLNIINKSNNIDEFIEDTFDVIDSSDPRYKKTDYILRLNDIFNDFKKHRTYNNMKKSEFSKNLLLNENIIRGRTSKKKGICGLVYKKKCNIDKIYTNNC